MPSPNRKRPNKKAHSAPKLPKNLSGWSQKLNKEEVPELLSNLNGSARRLEAGYYDQLYLLIALVAAVSAYLRGHPEAWDEFCRRRFWEKAGGAHPKKRHRDAPLRYVMRFAVGLGDRARKKANKYTNAVAPLIDKGINPDDLPDAIRQAGGIIKLMKLHRKGPKLRDAADHVEDAEDAESLDKDSLFDDVSDLGAKTDEGGGTAVGGRQTKSKPDKAKAPETGAQPARSDTSHVADRNFEAALPAELFMSPEDKNDLLSSILPREMTWTVLLLSSEGGGVMGKLVNRRDKISAKRAQAMAAKRRS